MPAVIRAKTVARASAPHHQTHKRASASAADCSSRAKQPNVSRSGLSRIGAWPMSVSLLRAPVERRADSAEPRFVAGAADAVAG